VRNFLSASAVQGLIYSGLVGAERTDSLEQQDNLLELRPCVFLGVGWVGGHIEHAGKGHMTTIDVLKTSGLPFSLMTPTHGLLIVVLPCGRDTRIPELHRFAANLCQIKQDF
jgi:hypothetical protein